MNQEKVGKFITKLRKEKGLTQQELADKLMVTDRAISNWENGRRMPDISFYSPLCEIFNITVNELISGEYISKNKFVESTNKTIINTLEKSKKDKVKFKNIIIILFIIVLSLTIITLKTKYPKIDMYKLYLGHLDPGFKLEKQFTYQTSNIYYYGVDNVQICDKKDNCVSLNMALNNKQTTLTKIKAYYEEQAVLNNIEKDLLLDGGTSIYNDKGYTIMFCNTIEKNNDIYIGNEDMIEKLNGNYCGKEEYKQKYFIRTYKVLTSSLDSSDPEFVNVTLENNQGDKEKVMVNATTNLVVGKTYEFIFYAYEHFTDTIKNIFNKSTLMYVNETDAMLSEQVNEAIYFNDDISDDSELNELEHVKMEIKEGTLTKTSATLVITDLSGYKYIYGSSYRIDKKENGKWTPLDIIYDCNCAWNAMAYGPDKSNKLVFDIDWNALYGTLSKGTYRIVKDATLNNEKPVNPGDELYISVSFNID